MMPSTSITMMLPMMPPPMMPMALTMEMSLYANGVPVKYRTGAVRRSSRFRGEIGIGFLGPQTAPGEPRDTAAPNYQSTTKPR